MADALRFEVRPIEGAVAVVGETVAFRREGDKLYALNEDGEAFGVVPSRFAAVICGRSVETLAAEVAERGEGGFLTLQVMFEAAGEGPAGESSAAPAEQAAPAAAGADASVPAGSAVPAAAQIERTAQASPAVGEATEEADAEGDAAVSGGTGPAAESAAIEEGWSPQGKKKLPAWAKAALVVLAAIVVIVLVVAAATSGSAEATQTMAAGHVEYEVPEDWTVEESDTDEDEGYEYLVIADPDDFNGVIAIAADWPSYYFSGTYLSALLIGLGVEGDLIDEYTTDEGAIVYLYDGVEIEDGSLNATGYAQIVISGDFAAATIVACQTDEFDDNADELLGILDTLVIIDAAEPTYSKAQAEEGTEETFASQVGHVAYEVPESWTVSDLSDDDSDFEYYYAFYADDFDGGLLVQADGTSLMFAEALMPYTLSGMGIEDDPIDEYLTDDGAHVYLYEYDLENSGNAYTGYMQIVVSGDYAAATYAYCLSDIFDYHAEELEEILYSVIVYEDDEDEVV